MQVEIMFSFDKKRRRAFESYVFFKRILMPLELILSKN